MIYKTFSGSSPPTRGPPTGELPGSSRPGIIPAYAGTTRRQVWRRRRPRDHPRLRGDHGGLAMAVMLSPGSSPPTRGPPEGSGRKAHTGRIIPAYAWTTGPRRPGRPGARDHPRLRGDHAPSSPVLTETPGSSPPTRGPHSISRTYEADDGIIPAYAGTTPRASGARRRGRWIIPAYAGTTVCGWDGASVDGDHPAYAGTTSSVP